MNVRQEKAIKYLLRTGTISVGEYQAVASCMRRTAQRDLEDMMERGVIKAVAKSQTDPTRHYVLLWQVTVTCCDILLRQEGCYNIERQKKGQGSLNAIVSTFGADIKNHSALAAGGAGRRIWILMHRANLRFQIGDLRLDI